MFANPSDVTRVVVAHHLGRPKPEGVRTIYQQQIRCLQDCGIDTTTNPRQMFTNNFVAALRNWKNKRERSMASLGMNDHVLCGYVAARLRYELGLIEVTVSHYPQQWH